MAAAQLVGGAIKKRQAKKKAAELAASRPELESSPYLQENLSLARSELANGMSAESERAYTQGSDRDFSGSLQAILQGGGSANNISELFDRSQTGRMRLSLMQDNLRLQQINNLFRAGGESENQRQQQFQFNQAAPWFDAAQANAGARQAGEQEMWSGINSLSSTAAGAIASNQNANAYNNYGNGGGIETGNFGYSNVRQQINSNVPSGNSMSPMATNTSYINPNYASSLFQ